MLTHTFESAFKISLKQSGYNYPDLLHIHLGQKNPHNNEIVPSVYYKNIKVTFCHLYDYIANCCTAGVPDWAHVRMVLTTVIWNFINFILIVVW